MTRTTLLITISVLISGCVSDSTLLVNKDGRYVRCQNSGWGYIGAPVAASRQKKCIKTAQDAGYRLVTDPEPAKSP